MKLSPNFYLAEFTTSQAAERAGLDNDPGPTEIANLQALVNNVLQPLRDAMGEPLIVSSGYRSPQVNELIGGAMESQHLAGEAADIQIFGIDNRDLAQYIIDLGLPFDQLILEYYSPQKGPNSGWVHVSHRASGGNRKSILRAIANPQTKQTEYFSGLG